jgi:hypothetical protein
MVDMIVYYLALPSTCLSGLSSAFIILIYLYNERIRRTDFGEYVLVLQIFDFGVTIAAILPTVFVRNATLCTIQAVLLQTFNLAEVLWSAYISVVIYCISVKHKARSSVKIPLIAISAISLVSGFVPITFDGYRLIANLCWIDVSSNQLSIILRVPFLYLPIWIVFFSECLFIQPNFDKGQRKYE